jgi:predicted dehydrogenase
VTLTWAGGRTADLSCDWRGRAVDSFEVRTATRSLLLDPLDSGNLHGDSGPATAPAENPHQPLFADFADAIRTGRHPVCPLDEAVVVDQVLSAAERSAGQPVPL